MERMKLPAFCIIFLGLISTGCMGTFETARVTTFRAGATYFATTESDENQSWNMPGIFLEGGFPGGPSRFGIGLHIKAALSVGDNDGFIAVWGGKLQFPENRIADVAVAVDMWGLYFPGEIKLHLSKRMGIFEPYVCLAIVDFLDYTEGDDGSIDIFSDEGNLSVTLGSMASLGNASAWKLAAELEAGPVWKACGFGAGIFREF